MILLYIILGIVIWYTLAAFLIKFLNRRLKGETRLDDNGPVMLVWSLSPILIWLMIMLVISETELIDKFFRWMRK